MSIIRIGIIGSGFMGRTYAEVLRKHTSGASLVAVAIGERAGRLALIIALMWKQAWTL